MDQPNRICPWCSTPIPGNAHACPQCGALVEGQLATDIPSVTVVDPTAKLGVPDEGNIPDDFDPKAWLRAGYEEKVDLEAVLPPNEAVRAEMKRMELEAQIENAGTTVMNPAGDESIEVNEPSAEAIAALQAGLLDDGTGPTDEGRLRELAMPWEDPDIEKNLPQ